MNPASIRIVMSLIQSSHSILDALLQMGNSTYLKCPTVTTIRALYAIQVIWTLWKSANRQHTCLSSFITEEVLSVRFYVRQIQAFLKVAIGPEGYQVPKMASNALSDVTNHLEQLERSSHPQSQQASVGTLPGDILRAAGSAPSNDLEVILLPGTTNADSAERCVLTNELQNADMLPSDRGIADNAAFQTSFDGLDGMDDEAPFVSEFDLMTIPDAAIDPNWLFSDMTGDYGQYRLGSQIT